MSRDVLVGEIGAPFGVKGWVKVRSETEPPDNILKYSPWRIGEGEDSREYEVLDGKAHGPGVIARLAGITDRDQAALLRKAPIWVARDQFPELKRGQYYWTDLIGLEVRTPDGLLLGTIVDMLATGANDVMEVRGDRDRLVPFIMHEYIKSVDLDQGVVIADWDPDF